MCEGGASVRVQSLSGRSGYLMLGTQRRLSYLLLIAVGLLAGNLHWSGSAPASGWAHTLASLLCIPVVAVAIQRGGSMATLIAIAGGSLHAISRAFGHDCSWIYVIGDTLLAVALGWMAAILSAILPAGHPPDVTRQVGAFDGDSALSEPWPTSVLTRVITGLVRQFGTPVASIEGAGWMLDDPDLPEQERREFIGIVRKESQRLSRILSEVLIFTRPRQPNLEQVNLSALLDDVIRFASPKDQGSAVIFDKNVPADLPRLNGDAEQIRQALLNVVLNAVQATPPGGHIEVSARVEGGRFVIAVEDKGKGVPEMALGRIFDPFFSTREKGLGLGLPVAQHIVGQHGGKISVDSVADKGTSVAIVLPVAPVR